MYLKITISKSKQSCETAKMATKIAELERGLGDILLAITESEKGRKHLSIKNDNPLVGIIINKILESVETK